jgi:CDP-diacylglycerol--glycerol-3-phosphate 3-phosphatidyltransferase/cardiolipin synthase
MAEIVLSDLRKPANLLSLSRIPLGVAFPFVHDTRALVAILAASGITDVLDGFVARRRGEATAMGAVVDPIADKIFAVSVVVTLFVRGALPGWGIAALTAREIIEAPLVLWILLHPPARRTRREEAKANVPGKVATTVQFAAVLCALSATAWVVPALLAAAVAGGVAGASYVAREIRWARARAA